MQNQLLHHLGNIFDELIQIKTYAAEHVFENKVCRIQKSAFPLQNYLYPMNEKLLIWLLAINESFSVVFHCSIFRMLLLEIKS